MKIRKGGIAVLAIVGAGMATTAVVATATHTPADKPFAAASKTVRAQPGVKVPLLTATVKNSKPTDMMLHVSMECSIITDTVLLGGTAPGGTESTRAEGRIRTWIEVDDQVVPIISQSAPPQNPPTAGDDTDKVTFCSRVFERTVQDKEDPQDGWDGSRDYIATKDANAFNWVRLNMGSGVHKIVLYGELTQSATGSSSADAYIGNRSMIGVPGKFANDAVINEVANG